MTLQHHYVDFDDVRLHYVDAGDGPLMLFVHGFPEFWYACQNQIEAFSRDFRAVALDLRGHNLSGKPKDVKAYRPKHLVADLRRLIDHLGGRPCIGVDAAGRAGCQPELLPRLAAPSGHAGRTRRCGPRPEARGFHRARADPGDLGRARHGAAARPA